MHWNHLKKFILLLLILFCADSAFSDDSSLTKSVGLEIDAAQHFLSEEGSGSMDFDTKFLSSLGISYTNTRTGDPGDDVNAWEGELTLNDNGKIFSAELSTDLLGDDQHRGGIGEKLSLGGTWVYLEGFDITLTLSGGATRFSASETTSPTAGTLAQLQRVRITDSEAITQFNPTAELEFSFFDGTFTTSGTISRYRYLNYVVGSGLAGSGPQENAAAVLDNTLVSGFMDWDWNVSATVNFPLDYSLSGIYTESLNLDTSSWTKSLEGTLSKDFNKRFSGIVGITHATEGGSGANTFKVGATFNF